ncbi:hypothetical protein CBS101457_002316 [Exobasidium rhododendri]|nr:hypothetical protein CBS101457_002316 [Exobasidium rhododendri]
MPTLPSRKLNRLWSSNSVNKSPPTRTSDLAVADDRYESSDNYDGNTDTSNSARQTSQEKDRQGKGAGTLAKDIEIRRQTNERLYSAAEAYWSSFNKKKSLPFEMNAASALEIAMTLDEAKEACRTTYAASSPLVSQAAEEGSRSAANHKDKVLPIDALGLAMASCANTYIRSESENAQEAIQLKRNEDYASHLSHLSAVHLALGQLQSEYTTSLSNTLLNRLARSQAAIEALKSNETATEAARDKMEAAEKRREKARDKGEKAKRDTEIEARMARATYEEAVDDLETRVEILRESEQKGPSSGVAILREYMDVHLAWVEAQHDVLLKARSALYQAAPPQISPTIHRPASIKSRAAPPPPPPASSQAPVRRIVEPPLPPREVTRNRSLSSPKIPKSGFQGRESLGTLVQKGDSTSKEEKNQMADRPASRSGIAARIPFMRSESYAASTSSADATTGSENASKAESTTKRSRLHSIGTSLARSSSSLALPTFDTNKPNQQGGTADSNSAGNEKGSTNNWASTLLGRKKDGLYRAMSRDGQKDSFFTPEDSSLSHVKEVSTESRAIQDDEDDDGILTNGFGEGTLRSIPTITTPWQDGAEEPALSSLSSNDHYLHHPRQDDILVSAHDEGHSPSYLKPWEKFEGIDSLGMHLTGNTASSSEGGNPFGHDGSELSPTATGTEFSPSPRKNMFSENSEVDDPAGSLLFGDKGGHTIRTSSKR